VHFFHLFLYVFLSFFFLHSFFIFIISLSLSQTHSNTHTHIYTPFGPIHQFLSVDFKKKITNIHTSQVAMLMVIMSLICSLYQRGQKSKSSIGPTGTEIKVEYWTNWDRNQSQVLDQLGKK
jgi:hypothetical protein